MKALLIGATGATGSDLLHAILKDDRFTQLSIFVRKKVNIEHPKLKVHIIDFDSPNTWKNLVIGDIIYSCLGTTLKVAGSKANQWKVDYEYQYEFAKAAFQNNVPTFVLVSSAYTSPNSLFFYSKMKGQLEVAIEKLNFKKLIIFNPPLLIRKNSDRLGENLGEKFITFFNNIGLFKSSKPLKTEVLAQAMIKSSLLLPNQVHRFALNEIEEYIS